MTFSLSMGVNGVPCLARHFLSSLWGRIYGGTTCANRNSPAAKRPLLPEKYVFDSTFGWVSMNVGTELPGGSLDMRHSNPTRSVEWYTWEACWTVSSEHAHSRVQSCRITSADSDLFVCHM